MADGSPETALEVPPGEPPAQVDPALVNRWGRLMAAITAAAVFVMFAAVPMSPAEGVAGYAIASGFLLWSLRGIDAMASRVPLWLHTSAALAVVPTLFGGRWCSAGCGPTLQWPALVGVIVPLLGLVAHIGAVLGIARAAPQGLRQVVVWWSVPAVAGSGAAVAVMVSTGLWCRWCGLAHALMLVLVVRYWRSSRAGEAMPLWAAGTMAGLIYALIPFQSGRPTDGAQVAALLRSAPWVLPTSGANAASGPRLGQVGRRSEADATRWGSASAPVTVLLVSDVDCPTCRQTWQTLRATLGDEVQAGRVAVRVLALGEGPGASLARSIAACGLLGSEEYAQALDAASGAENVTLGQAAVLASPAGARYLREKATLDDHAATVVADGIALATRWGVVRAPRIWVLRTGNDPGSTAPLAPPYTATSLRTATATAASGSKDHP